MVQVVTKRTALASAIALLLALSYQGSAQSKDARVATDGPHGPAERAMRRAAGPAERATERGTGPAHQKVGDRPPRDDVDDLSELITEGESIGGAFQGRDEAKPTQTSPLDRLAEEVGLPITGTALLAMAAIGGLLITLGAGLLLLARRKGGASLRPGYRQREIEHT